MVCLHTLDCWLLGWWGEFRLGHIGRGNSWQCLALTYRIPDWQDVSNANLVANAHVNAEGRAKSDAHSDA
jgi:hypothetical protein